MASEIYQKQTVSFVHKKELMNCGVGRLGLSHGYLILSLGIALLDLENGHNNSSRQGNWL